jgi:dTDP-4-dehydrorhamnose reductase
MAYILVTGGSGQVGLALQRHPMAAGFRVFAPSRQILDLRDRDSIWSAFAATSPAAVINAGAYTAVDRAESESDLAYAVNAHAPALLAELCAHAGIPLLHVSTDYVFNGAQERPWHEDDETGPLGVYGASKLAGETAIRDTCPHHMILRTAWVFSASGQNFVKTMLRLGQERPTLRIVSDQTGCPTAAYDIAGALWTITRTLVQPDTSPDRYGTFHYSGAPAVSWFDFADVIFERARQAGLPTPALEAIPTTAYPTPARRPAWSVLDCRKIKAVFDLPQPDWRVALANVVADLAAKSLVSASQSA